MRYAIGLARPLTVLSLRAVANSLNRLADRVAMGRRG